MTDPIKRGPGDAVNIMHVADAIGWDIPTFIERGLYAAEILERHPSVDDQNMEVAAVLSSLRTQIDKALATTAGDDDVIKFKHWRKTSEKVTKAKPVELKCSLFENPTYGTIWGLIEYA